MQHKPCIYLKYDTIKGYSKNKKFKNRIMVYTCKFQLIKYPSRGGGYAGGTPIASPITFTKLQDFSSAFLYKEACVGTPQKLCFDLSKRVQGTPVEGIKIEAFDCVISSLQVKIHGATPVETYAVNFSKVGVTSNSIDPQGKEGKKQYYEFINLNYHDADE